MRTLLSQLDTARMSAEGEKARSETVSSGGLEIATSFFKSPMVVVPLEAALEVVPKIPDIVTDHRCIVWCGCDYDGYVCK